VSSPLSPSTPLSPSPSLLLGAPDLP
jgi:hypothetical protein